MNSARLPHPPPLTLLLNPSPFASAPLAQRPTPGSNAARSRWPGVTAPLAMKARVRLGQSAALVLPLRRHNQGGGGERAPKSGPSIPHPTLGAQGAEHFTAGVCCNAQNLFDPVHRPLPALPAFQRQPRLAMVRELYLTILRLGATTLQPTVAQPASPPRRAPRGSALRFVDSDEQCAVVFGGEGSHEGNAHLRPAHERMALAQAQPAARVAQRRPDGLRRRAPAPHLFGAQFTDDPRTWAYDLRANQWRRLRPPTLPPPIRTTPS